MHEIDLQWNNLAVLYFHVGNRVVDSAISFHAFLSEPALPDKVRWTLKRKEPRPADGRQITLLSGPPTHFVVSSLEGLPDLHSAHAEITRQCTIFDMVRSVTVSKRMNTCCFINTRQFSGSYNRPLGWPIRISASLFQTIK
jgi:hypothetical protein